MSCQPYLQWWISPLAHLLLKTDHLVSLLLFLLPCSLNSSTSALLSWFVYHRAFYLSFAFAILLLPCCDFSLLFPVSTLFSRIVGDLQPSSKLNDSCLWPLQRQASVLLLSHTVCFTVVSLLSSLLHLSAHVCSKPTSNCLLSIQYPSQVIGSTQAPISSKPSLK